LENISNGRLYFNQILDFVAPIILVSETGTSHGKGKVVPLYSMKAYRGNIGAAPLMLNLGIVWRWEVNLAPQPL
jgi:hypothetical protein